MKVKLLSHSPDPLRSVYVAFRTCYSQKSPDELWEESGRVSRDKMVSFIEKYAQVGHTSPFEQVWFEFAVSGISRALSHQLVRHRVGVSFEQQSQRYVKLGNDAEFVVPPSVSSNQEALEVYTKCLDDGRLAYDKLVELGVPPEDARYILPNATPTNIKLTINMTALMHMCDIRLCTRAQWEFRRLVSLMRAEVNKVEPVLGRMLGIKCLPNRRGYCDETYESYLACPLSRVRPHKRDIIGLSEAM
ncbi:MAG: FAD-dependent thymidylate synthase [Candidatus Caldarchaeum sp.]